MHFFYDGETHPVKIEFNGTMYGYVHNIRIFSQCSEGNA